MVEDTRLVELRNNKDWKQKDIAKKLNVLPNTYSKWERGINDIPLNKFNELATLYDVSMDYLLGLNNKNEKVNKKILDYNKLKERLLTLRKENNLTQEKLSDAIGFHQRTYSHYEDGSRIPTTFKLYYIAIYYKISFDYLVGRTDKK